MLKYKPRTLAETGFGAFMVCVTNSNPTAVATQAILGSDYLTVNSTVSRAANSVW